MNVRELLATLEQMDAAAGTALAEPLRGLLDHRHGEVDDRALVQYLAAVDRLHGTDYRAAAIRVIDERNTARGELRGYETAAADLAAMRQEVGKVRALLDFVIAETGFDRARLIEVDEPAQPEPVPA